MDDHCKCCGVKYTGDMNLKPSQFIDDSMDRNFRWIVDYHDSLSKKICLFCAVNVPALLAEIAINPNYTCGGYNFQNFKSHPVLAERIKSIQSIFGCPRCGTEMKKIESVAPFSGEKEMINKCFNCGYC